MDLQTHNFINLAFDFLKYWKVPKDKNPIHWTKTEQDELIKTVSEKDPNTFKRFGYYIENGFLYWSVNLK